MATPMKFREPIVVGTGFEPNVDVDSAGTIFLSGAGFVGDGASRLWRSTDTGRTFNEVTGLNGATSSLDGFEGDIAVDAKDRLYYFDTWVGDNHVYRYSDHGATLDFVRPAAPTPEADDRPWLAAHHDGYVYYLGNAAAGPGGRLVFHRSTDGGLTFDPLGYLVPNSGFGFLDADPNSDHVYIAVDNTSPHTGVAPTAVFVSMSADRGATWTQTKVADLELSRWPLTAMSITVAVAPNDGSVYVAWNERTRGDSSDIIRLARSTDHGRTWRVRRVTPFPAKIDYTWMTVSPRGDVGISFFADELESDDAEFHVYAMVWRERSTCRGATSTRCPGPASAVARLSKHPVLPQGDFFQSKFSPDGALNVPFRVGGQVRRVAFTRQVAGPNLKGGSFCGHAKLGRESR
ncbi:MAG TPA: hypothetical protein VNA12_04850 [Mycobacteriales bacterium]|nr:hypothetical protein [Mycobacteriales bacterium]